jgi:hypothetical protein
LIEGAAILLTLRVPTAQAVLYGVSGIVDSAQSGKAIATTEANPVICGAVWRLAPNRARAPTKTAPTGAGATSPPKSIW